MKVMHIITGLSQGGAERTLVRLALSGNNNVEHVVISLTNKGVYANELQAAGVRVYCLNQKSGLFFLKALLELGKLVARESPDVIQSWMYHSDAAAAVIALCYKIPLIWNVRQTEISIRSSGISAWAAARLCAILSHHVPIAVVSCSNTAILYHRRFGYANKFIYIANGFECKQNYFPAVTTTTPTHPVFGHVGRLHPVKNHSGFLEAASVLEKRGRKFRLLLAGSGVHPDNPAFKAIIPENLINTVDAKGAHKNIDEIYAAMTCFVLSSHSEAFPNVVAEAMLNGIPCIVTDVGDAAEIVGDTGWIVPRRDATALMEAMNAALDEMKCPDMWSERKRRAQIRIITRFSIREMTSRYLDIWTSAKGE